MEALKSIVKFSVSIFKYICLYFYKSISYFIKFIYFICFCVYKFFKYIFYGALWPFVIIAELFSNILYKIYKRRNKKIVDVINKNNKEIENMDTSFVEDTIDNIVTSEKYKNDNVNTNLNFLIILLLFIYNFSLFLCLSLSRLVFFSRFFLKASVRLTPV